MIIGVPGHQRRAQLLLETSRLGPAVFRQPAQLVGHARVLLGQLQRFGAIRVGLPPARQQGDHRLQLGVAPAQLGQAGGVGDDLRVGELRLDFAVGLFHVGQSLRQVSFHQVASDPRRAAIAEGGTSPRASTSPTLSSSRAVSIEAIATSI